MRIVNNFSINDAITEICAPRTVYHYCSISTAQKILTEGCLWMTHFRFLNDKQEMSFYVDELRHALHRSQDVWGSDTVISHLNERLASDEFPPRFVASFSVASDDFNQWHKYGDGGKGVAIGFRVDGPTCRECGGFEMRDNMVKYGDDGIDQEAERIIANESERAHHWSKPVSENVRNDSYQHTAIDLAGRIVDEAIFRKREIFSVEKEWRWLLRPLYVDGAIRNDQESLGENHNPEGLTLRRLASRFYDDYTSRLIYRDSNDGKKPYVSFNFRDHDIEVSEIVIGPCANAGSAEVTIDLLCDKLSYGCTVRRSEI